MFLVEHTSDDAWSQTARRIKRSTRVIHTNEFGDEESEPDADGGNECSYSSSASYAVTRRQ